MNDAMTAARPPTIFDDLAAPAPRFLMRLALLRELIELLPSPVNRFLEIGPGLGDVSQYLARRFPTARGQLMDISPDCTALLRERFMSNDRLVICDGDFHQLPGTGQYDLIIACEVFEHLENDDAAFASVNRLLSAGGHFLFSVPAFKRKWQNADVFAGHYRRYERDELAAKFTQHGFTIERLWCFGFPVTELTYPLRQWYYRPRRNDRPMDKREATQRSGIERSFVRKFRRVPWATILSPFFATQRLVRDRDIGDGFLALARKNGTPPPKADAR